LNKVQVEILGLSASPSTGGAYALLLKEVFGARRLPIIIGSFEAQSIALEIEGIKPPRPLTHDLLKNMIDLLGGTVSEVIINELRDNTFFAKIKIEVSSLSNEIDSRPSDAIALAVRTGAPLYVAEEVMKIAAFIPSSDDKDEIDDQFPEKETETKENNLPAVLIKNNFSDFTFETFIFRTIIPKQFNHALCYDRSFHIVG
jgi:bifunctional DNase/RNase